MQPPRTKDDVKTSKASFILNIPYCCCARCSARICVESNARATSVRGMRGAQSESRAPANPRLQHGALARRDKAITWVW